MKKYLRKSVKLLIALGISIVFTLGFNNKNSTAASNTDIRPGYRASETSTWNAL